jgi:hypothetical protein
MDWEDTGKSMQALWLALESTNAKRLRRVFGRLFGRDIFYGDQRHYAFAHGRHKSSRIALVNHLIHLNGYQSYLEIGVRDQSDMFESVNSPHSVSVDPDPTANADHSLPSDEFFARNEEKFDIVFIDGNHTGEQVERDILNSLSCLSPNGVILLHDMNPPTMFHARHDYEVSGKHPSWNGTSWKGYAALRKSRSDLSMNVVDTDWGVGIVRRGHQDIISIPCETYTDLSANRKEILNLISVAEFLELNSTPCTQATGV